MKTIRKTISWLGAAILALGLVFVIWKFYEANRRADELLIVMKYLIGFPFPDFSSLP